MRFGQLAAMTVVTLFAIAVMFASGGWKLLSKSKKKDEPTEEIIVAPAPVSVRTLRIEKIDVIQRYSGMIEPRERLTLAFEIPGRIESLGENTNGQAFDEGVRVAKNDTLAVLDTRELLAAKAEADAMLLQAQQENERAIKLSQKNPLAINKVELLNRETTLKIAEARADLAKERLRYATLLSPVDGVISKRQMLPGESVGAHQAVFEILQVDQVVLVVGVPESKVRSLLERFRAHRRHQEVGSIDAKPLQADVRLVGQDAFGNPWKPIERAEVITISESADEDTGLFNVEIAIDNKNGELRPGQIAIVDIIADEVEGVRLPSTAAIFENKKGHFFVVKRDQGQLKAKKISLPEGGYREQKNRKQSEQKNGEPDEPKNVLILRRDRIPNEDLSSVIGGQIVVGGQHRLTDGRPVRVVKRYESAAEDPSPPRGDDVASRSSESSAAPNEPSRK